MIINNNCLECSDLLRGRVDKKFCSDSCRNVYNNRVNGNVNNYVRNVNNVLRKNRRILESLFRLGDKQVHKGLLIEMEFNFQYFTHKKFNRDSVTFCIYDYEYTSLENSKYVVISLADLSSDTGRRKTKKLPEYNQFRANNL